MLVGTDSFNHISSHSTTKNGRRAWLSLKSVYEGVDFSERQRETTFTRLTHTFYKGETARFNMEKYIAIHKNAHKMLEDAGYNGGMGMDEATKIQHFKSGIKSDAGLEVALTSLRADPTKYSDFTQVTTFLMSEVEHKTIRRAQLKSSVARQV